MVKLKNDQANKIGEFYESTAKCRRAGFGNILW